MNQDQKKRLFELASGHIEQTLSASEVSELEALLDDSPENLRIFSDFMHDHATLHWSHVSHEDEESPLEFSSPSHSRLPSLPQLLAAAAVISLLALVLIKPDPAPPSFATMTHTEAAHWESGDLPTADGSRIGSGYLKLAKGLATLSFDSGAEVILEGPAELELVNAMNCILRGGTAVVEIAESAKGFRIETPRANVIDHGTRFAVNVDPGSGATQTQVFEGLVEVELNTTKESIELREGQRNTVTGGTLGAINESPEEGAWSPRQVSLTKDSNWTTVTTAQGNGHDGYVWGGKQDDHVSDELLLLKHSQNTDGPHRKAYLRFDLTEYGLGQIAEAELTLQFSPTGWGLASLVNDCVFEVFGLTDDTLDNWNYPSMRWEDAPANVFNSGDQLQKDKVTSLGVFTVPRGVQAGTFHLHGEPLTDFLNQDNNRLATIILVRRTTEQRQGGLVHGLASSRHPTLPAPALALKRQ
tara:strand:- start:2884 stop:4296 length:1413 start_codon:yes stop_codon:yes gene_type:complete